MFLYSLQAPITPKKLERKGQSCYKAGKICLFIGLVGLILFVLSVTVTGIIGTPEWVSNQLALQIGEQFAFMYPIMILSYLGMLTGSVGCFLYFIGLILFALGRIAKNTEKE